jgi:DNA-directed RNA polymerase specialized sigma24 family protein
VSLDAAHSFLDAAQRGDNEAMRHAMAALAPVLAPPLRWTLQRHHSLVQRCRLESEDVVQRVFERMLASPPNNPRAQDPLAVLTAWARAVAINYLLDLARRVGREAPLGLDSDGDPLEDAATVTPSAPQERQHQAAEQWRLARHCADTELARHKHLRELFYAIAEEPELGARELAQRIGLLSGSAPIDEAAARRAEQYVWKLRERVQRKLADYFEALERGSAQGAR